MSTLTYIGKKILQILEDNNDKQSYIKDWQKKLCNLDCDNKKKLAQSMAYSLLVTFIVILLVKLERR
jgi:hypothetical protein